MSDKVYYDESCYVCSLEINAVRKRGEACGITFVDISDPNFNEEGDFETEMVGQFNGEPTIGIDTFRLMYEKMGFKKIVAITRLPILKQIFNSGYWIFAHCIRPYLPKKIMKVKFKNFGLGRKMAEINDKYYIFVSIGHPWNECAAYLSDEEGNILEDEPVLYSVGGSAYSLAMELI